VEPDQLAALGVYDPSAADAELRLELLDYLIALGASEEELVTFNETLPALAGLLAIRGGPAVSLEEAAARSGISESEMRSLVRAAGFAQPEPGARMFTRGFVEFAAGMDAIATVFGEDARTQWVRVLGSAMARVADAAVSAFLVNVEPPARRSDRPGLAVARANVEVAELLPLVGQAMDALFRQHLLVARRLATDDADLVGFEKRRLVVGFIDLVGSTSLGEHVDLSELRATLADFERISSEAITDGGGRVVKLIGDEIMFTALEAGTAASIALDLADTFGRHPTIPPVRAALASGEVIVRDGDVFGPVVNLASRALKLAQPGQVIATPEVAAAAGLPHRSIGVHRLRGMAGATELERLTRA
jgi:adenylate cyclase